MQNKHILCETYPNFLGYAMVPKSQERQTFLTTFLYKAEHFTLNLWQTYDAMLAIVPDKAHLSLRIACLLASSLVKQRMDTHQCSQA